MKFVLDLAFLLERFSQRLSQYGLASVCVVSQHPGLYFFFFKYSCPRIYSFERHNIVTQHLYTLCCDHHTKSSSQLSK